MKVLLSVILSMFIGLSALANDYRKVEFNSTNSVTLNEQFDSISIGKVIEDLSKLDSNEPSSDPIYLVLMTPGGYITDGLTLFSFVKGMNRPVHTITIFAASMGFQTVQNLGDRLILQHGILMSHKAQGGFKGEFGGKTSQVLSRYNIWVDLINSLDNTTVLRTNGKKTLEQYQQEYDNELWLLGEKAVSEGYADEVVSARCATELSQGSYEQSFSLSFLRVTATFSKCPIDTTVRNIKIELPTNKGYMTLKDYISNGGVVDKICKSSSGGGLLGALLGGGDEGNKSDGAADLCLQNPELIEILHGVESRITGGKLNLVDVYMNNVIPMTFRTK